MIELHPRTSENTEFELKEIENIKQAQIILKRNDGNDYVGWFKVPMRIKVGKKETTIRILGHTATMPNGILEKRINKCRLVWDKEEDGDEMVPREFRFYEEELQLFLPKERAEKAIQKMHMIKNLGG